MEENFTLVDKIGIYFHPYPRAPVKVNVMEPRNASTGKGMPLSEKSNQSTLDQSIGDALVQMNQQLVGVMKQNAETMTVMKAVLQRQEIPKPDSLKFAKFA